MRAAFAAALTLLTTVSGASITGCGGGGGDPPARIAFAARRIGDPPSPANTVLLFQDVGGFGSRVVRTDAAAVVSYLPSRDGTRVLVTRDVSGTGTANVWLADSTGRLLREVLPAGSFDPVALEPSWAGDGHALLFAEGSLVMIPPSSGVYRWISTIDVDDGTVRRAYPIDAQYTLSDVRSSSSGRFSILRYRRGGGPTDFFRIDTFDLLAPAVIDESVSSGEFDGVDPTPRWLPNSTGYYFVRIDPARPRSVVGANGTFPASGPDLFDIGADAQILDFVMGPGPTGGGVDTPCAAVVRRSLSSPPVGGPASIDELVVDRVGGIGDGPSFPLDPVFRVNETLFDPTGTSIWLDVETVPAGGGPPVRSVQVFDAATAQRRAVIGGLLDLVDFDRETGDVAVQVEPGGESQFLPVAGIWTLDSALRNARRLEIPGWVVEGPPRFFRSIRFSSGFAGSGEIR